MKYKAKKTFTYQGETYVAGKLYAAIHPEKIDLFEVIKPKTK